MKPFSIRHLAKVWVANTKISIIREMEFRGNFLLGIFRQFSWVAAFVFMVEIIFRNTASLNGWAKPEMLIILSLSRFIEGTVDLFVSRNIAMFPQSIQKGTFDFFLTKPIPAQFAFAFQKFYIYNIGNVVSGLMLFVYALMNLETPLSSGVILSFATLVVTSFIVFYSFLILVACLVFYFERLEALYGIMTLFTEPLTVPFDIFPRVPRLAITYIIPIAFIVFVPAQAITSKLHTWQIPVAILVAAIFLTLANLAWSSGLKRYTSASS